MALTSFQPIWSIWPASDRLNFELLVVDDDDAFAQVDVLYEAFASEPCLRSSRRSQ